MRNIAKRTGTSPTALFRHKQQDIPASLAKAKQAAEEVRAETLFERLQSVNRETVAILKEARESGSPSIALAAIGRVEKQLELEARLLGQLNDPKIAVGIKIGAPELAEDLSHLSNEQLAEKAETLARRFREMAERGG